MSETRLIRLLKRIRGPRDDENPRSLRGRVGTGIICVLAGAMLTASAIAARGTDLRSDRNTDLRGLVATQAQRNEQLRGEVAEVRAEVEELGHQQGASPELEKQQRAVAEQAAAVPVTGPGMRVTLTDAPTDVRPAGVDDDALVVHQQDIQAVVNALWKGGAEAVSIQGQRIISTSGIKCVGNSVVLHGIPYAPPYVIEAIGDADRMAAALKESRALTTYRQYADAYGLGYRESVESSLSLPAFQGALGITHAKSR